MAKYFLTSYLDFLLSDRGKYNEPNHVQLFWLTIVFFFFVVVVLMKNLLITSDL